MNVQYFFLIRFIIQFIVRDVLWNMYVKAVALEFQTSIQRQ